MLHDPQMCPTTYQSPRATGGKATTGGFRPQKATKHLFRLHSQISTNDENVTGWWRDHSPCDRVNVSSIQQLAYASQLDRELPGHGDSFHFLLSHPGAPKFLILMVKLFYHISDHHFLLIQKTRLNTSGSLSLLFLPKSCIPEERSCLFFDSYWVDKWPESSINNFLCPIIWKQGDSFLIYEISSPLEEKHLLIIEKLKYSKIFIRHANGKEL